MTVDSIHSDFIGVPYREKSRFRCLYDPKTIQDLEVLGFSCTSLIQSVWPMLSHHEIVAVDLQ